MEMENYLKKSYPMFAFNIWNIDSAKAIMDAAKLQNKDVILQTSASIYEQMEFAQLKQFIESYTKDGKIKAWLHLDHCKNLYIIESAIANGWDSVMIDASAMPIEENIKITNQVTELAHAKGVLVEAEIGQVSGVEDNISVLESAVAGREDIDKFLQETNVDMIAVAFGNAHGIYQGSPKLDYNLVEYTTKHTDIPFVVHGGSGLSDEVLRRLLAISGVRKINISTEVKMAYREGLLCAKEQGMLEEKGFQAVKVEKVIHDSIVELAIKKMQLLE